MYFGRDVVSQVYCQSLKLQIFLVPRHLHKQPVSNCQVTRFTSVIKLVPATISLLALPYDQVTFEHTKRKKISSQLGQVLVAAVSWLPLAWLSLLALRCSSHVTPCMVCRSSLLKSPFISHASPSVISAVVLESSLNPPQEELTLHL